MTTPTHTAEDIDYVPLHYVLPRTSLTVTATVNTVLKATETIEDGMSTWSTDTVDENEITLSNTIVPDHQRLYTIDVPEKLLEKRAITIEIDKNRIITGINSGVSRDLSPIMGAIKTVVTLAAGFTLAADSPKTDSLESQWAERYRYMSTKLEALTVKLRTLLDKLSDAGVSAEESATIGAAMQPIKTEIAAIDSQRREWIAGHAKTTPETSDFGLQDLVRIFRKDAPSGNLPATVPAKVLEHRTEAQKVFGERYSTLIAFLDLEREALLDNILAPPVGPKVSSNIIMRLPRSVTFGMYRNGEDGQMPWTLDRSTIKTITVLDDYSDVVELDLTSSWTTERNLQLVLDIDQSIKTWGVSLSSTFGSVITSAADIVSTVGTAYKDREKTPDADQQAATLAKAKLDLLKTSSELSKLARGYGLEDEVALAESLVRIADKD